MQIFTGKIIPLMKNFIQLVHKVYCLHFYSLIKDGKEQIMLSGVISWCYRSVCTLHVFCIQKNTVESEILFTEGRVNLNVVLVIFVLAWRSKHSVRSLSQLFVFPFVKTLWLLQLLLLKWFSGNCCNSRSAKYRTP